MYMDGGGSSTAGSGSIHPHDQVKPPPDQPTQPPHTIFINKILKNKKQQVEDLIMIQLTHGAGYIPLEGAALKGCISQPGGSRPFKVGVGVGGLLGVCRSPRPLTIESNQACTHTYT